MKLSAPIHELKSLAKKLKKAHSISLAQSLNQVAQQEGYLTWSLLISKERDFYPKTYDQILNYLNPGDGVIVASRPKNGKTNFCIGLFVKAIIETRYKHFFFSLGEIDSDIIKMMQAYHANLSELSDNFEINCSDNISSEYIIEKTKNKLAKGSIIVIDYLQLLDQKRQNSPLDIQVNQLLTYAKTVGCIVIFLSQISRNVKKRENARPSIEDLNLPNPINLQQFNKILCLYKEDDSDELELNFQKPKHFTLNLKWDPKVKVFS
ncbi:DNA helicase [bacterium]|nr:DNA helicase [bacterium]